MKTFKYIFLIGMLSFTLTSCAQDNIVGIWEVKNEYYQATYEIVAYQGKFFGKVHYYNDGKEIYKGDNRKEDYFLTDIELKNGKYINGKMYLPDGSYYNTIFCLKDMNNLEVKMTIEGEPYTEIWTRKIN